MDARTGLLTSFFALVSGVCAALPLHAQCPQGTVEIGRTETAGKITVKCAPIKDLTLEQMKAIKPELLELLGSEDRQQFESRKKKLDAETRFKTDLLARVGALDAQIAETEKQLREMGFKNSLQSFDWTGGESRKAQQHMIGQLILHLRNYTIEKSEKALEEGFLAHISKMKPKEVNKLADSLQQLGANEPLFQEWLRSFSEKVPRKVLTDGAKLAIEAAKAEGRLFKISEEMSKETVQGKQEAALTVIAMLGVDFPVMKELKLVASGSYDVAEAWATILVLDRHMGEMTTAVDTQLASQKKILLHMKALVDERKETRKVLESVTREKK